MENDLRFFKWVVSLVWLQINHLLKKKNFKKCFRGWLNFHAHCGSLPDSKMISKWCYYDCASHPNIIMHCSGDILNIDLKIEYIIGNGRRKHDLISSIPPSPIPELLKVMSSQGIPIISNRIFWCMAHIYKLLPKSLCWKYFVHITALKGLSNFFNKAELKTWFSSSSPIKSTWLAKH